MTTESPDLVDFRTSPSAYSTLHRVGVVASDNRTEEALDRKIGVCSAFAFSGRCYSVEAALFQIERGDFILNAADQYLFDHRYHNTARGHYGSDGNGTYDAEDISIVVNPGRTLRAGVSVSF